MRVVQQRQARRGAIIPLVAISLVALLGMVALAIDIGMVAIAKNQAQNAADSAATATVRTFTGQSGYNLAAAPVQGVTAAVANSILGTNVVGNPGSVAQNSTDVYTSGNVTIKCGGYYYLYNDGNPAAEAFTLMVGGGKPASQPYTAATATVTTTSPTFFGSVFGATPFNVTASASAAYRPRDVVMIMDMSGSMRFESMMGMAAAGSAATEQGQRTISMNPDPNYPVFGHYSNVAGAALLGTTIYPTADVMAPPGNQVYPAYGGSAIIADYTSDGTNPAFSAAPTSYATTPGGDNYLQSGGSYIQTVSGLLGFAVPATNAQTISSLNWCRNGYQAQTGTAFNGYTQGPNYWGKTFFIWPPDPQGSDLDATNAANHANNGANDWRQRFFFKVNSSTGTLYWLDQNTVLFNQNGSPNSNGNPVINRFGATGKITAVTENGASVNYYCLPNYAAIFQWLKNQTPTGIFPASMLSGRIQYYSKIPDPTGDNSFNTRFWTQNPMTDLSERFWKDYVDFMLGQVQTGAGTYANTGGILATAPFSSMIGTGDLYSWGTMQVTQKQDCNYTATINNVGGYAAGYTGSISLNNVQDLNGNAYNLAGAQPITGASNASPIVITSASHGLATGNVISIPPTGSVGGPLPVAGNTGANNSAANPTWTVTVLDANTFSLNGSTGNGAYSANTGSWTPTIINASNTSPIVITTGAPHGLTTSPQMTVNLTGVTGNTAANGTWIVTVINGTQFSLNSSTGNGAFTTNPNQWWEPVYYLRFGNLSTFYQMIPATTPIGFLTGTPDIALTQAVANSSAVKVYTTVPTYMTYTDNPYRPKHQFWFGPQTWLDWLGNYSTYCYTRYATGGTYTLRWAGNTHESQAWACKLGLSTAITDFQNNHPADYIGLTFFSNPYDPRNTTYPGFYNGPVVPLGQSYTTMQNSLWFPPTTVTGSATSITPYDTDFLNVPRAQGGTAPGMGFMLAYNMLSSSVSNLRLYSQPNSTYRGFAGGMGRKGAQRLVIFETDGDPNWEATASLVSANSDSYYPIRLQDPTNIASASNQFPTTSGGYNNTQVFNVISQITAQTTASPPGFSTARKPAQVYAIGYGSLFDPANSALPHQAAALTFLQAVQYYGGTSNNTTGSSFPSSQLIYGASDTRAAALQTCISNIVKNTVSISLLQ